MTMREKTPTIPNERLVLLGKDLFVALGQSDTRKTRTDSEGTQFRGYLFTEQPAGLTVTHRLAAYADGGLWIHTTTRHLNGTESQEWSFSRPSIFKTLWDESSDYTPENAKVAKLEATVERVLQDIDQSNTVDSE